MRGLLLAATLCAASLACATPSQLRAAEPLANQFGAGPRYGQPPLSGLGGPLDLVDQHGRSFSLHRLQGRPVLVFFGFTRCGDTCPLALAQASQILAQFRSRQPPAVVFVTLDPLNDDPRSLAAYLSSFDPRIIGLTGKPEHIEQAARRYGVGTQPRDGTLDHSSRWYLLDERLNLSRVYKLDTPPNHIAQDIVALPTARPTPMTSGMQP